MTGKTIKINGADYTDAFTPVGYSVSYRKIRGRNTGYMLDGSYTDDVLAIKAVISCTCMPANEERLSEILSETVQTYVDVYYFDPREKSYRTAVCIPSEPSQTYRGKGGDAVEYWTGTVIQFTEK